MPNSLTGCQQRAWGLLQSQENVFLTGNPGTGKSYLIQHYLRDQALEPPVVLASTGAAACLIGGRTFHSFFGLGRMQGGLERVVQDALKNSRLKRRLRRAHSLVIDEVSMLSYEAFDCAEKIACLARDSLEPWGGLRVIAVGDFAQLPPVSRERQKPWSFLGEAWAKSQFRSVVLREVMRTQDEAFLTALSKIRNAEMDVQVEEFLEECCQREPARDAPRILARRDQVELFNQERLQSLEGKEFEFLTKYVGNDMYIDRLQKEAPIAPIIRVKRGALVMLRMNDPKQRYVNGSLATVYDANEKDLTVELEGRLIKLEKFCFSYMNADGEEVASAENFPVSLAYASTIHKTQGASLDALHANLRNLWEPGQAYVALSRLRSSERLSIEAWSPNSFIADPLVTQFHESLGA